VLSNRSVFFRHFFGLSLAVITLLSEDFSLFVVLILLTWLGLQLAIFSLCTLIVLFGIGCPALILLSASLTATWSILATILGRCTPVARLRRRPRACLALLLVTTNSLRAQKKDHLSIR